MNSNLQLDRSWISAHIAQHGRMCLLDEVLWWNEQQLLCRSASHRASDHPLRAHGRLGSACAIEYAAQAAAVHGALMQGAGPAARGESGVARGMLASARAVQLAVERLDDVIGHLLIEARRLQGSAVSALYAFTVHAQRGGADQGAGRLLAQGRLSLWLQGSAAPWGAP